MKKMLYVLVLFTLVLSSVQAQASILDIVKQHQIGGDAGASEDEWVCENCGATNNWNFCGNCGAARPVSVQTQPSPVPTAPPEGDGGSESSILNVKAYYALIPEVFAENLNNYTGAIAPDLFKGKMSDEEINRQKQFVTVQYTESEGNAVYYDNADWSVEAAGFFYDTNADPRSSADEISLSFAKSLDANLIDLLRYGMSLCCREADPSVSANDINSWLRGNRSNGDVYQMTGCYLTLLVDDSTYQYSIIRTHP